MYTSHVPYTPHRHRLARDAAYGVGGASIFILLFTAFLLAAGIMIYLVIWLSYITGVALLRASLYPWRDRDWYAVMKDRIPWTMHREWAEDFWSHFKGYN